VRKAILVIIAILTLLGMIVGSSGCGSKGSADLGVTSTVDNEAPEEGDTITYTITLTNNGPDEATDIELTGVLPAGLTYVSNSASQGAYDSTSGVWAVKSLADGTSATLDITATVNAGAGNTTATITAIVTKAHQKDPVPDNNSASRSADISPIGGHVLPGQTRLRVATTTSLYDTGLWSYLEPIFERDYNCKLDILYAGTGIALQYGRNGDVDVLTVHSKADELKFIADGYGVERVPFAYNYFEIVGPESDPAGLSGLTPEEAFKKLYDNPGSGTFVSRGDNSGTHSKEKAIWASAGLDYNTVKSSGSWYVDAGSGMGPTLLKASELQAYTLTDEGTFLAYKGRQEIDLVPIVTQGSIMLNVYSVIVCTQSTKQEMANNLVDFLTSSDIQALIGNYGVTDYGKSLFIPCAGIPEPTS
jgi:tungstate transport system substrate-binding protein